MANFNSAIEIVLKHEGGFVNDPRDSGGATNYGISLRFYRQVKPNATVADIRNLTKDDAKQVYYQTWWIPNKFGDINDQTIATKIFDLAINMGSSQAFKITQRAINSTSNSNLVVDGVFGAKSLAAINQYTTTEQQQKLITAISDQAWKFYQQVIANNPKNSAFSKGWFNRAYSIGVAKSIR